MRIRYEKETDEFVRKMMDDLGQKADPKIVEKVAQKVERALGFKNKVRISIGLDPDIVEFFQKDGPGYQTRINAALRECMNQRRKV
jgi:uncharacterized protein (DUF4415 family)